jgi:diguanylate cyclase (GGDEF)-like protein
VDNDPLTGLDNRRALQAILRAVQPKGATLLFFDLDDFKGINDLHGHHMGDECLKQFATALRECFRPDDHVVRYAGDEFLVIASGLDRAAVEERVGQVRWRLRKAAGQIPYFTFSVGVGDLAPGGKPEAALKDADEAMYRHKSGVRQAAASA